MKPLQVQITQKQNSGIFHKFGILLVALLAWCSLASAQHWTPVTSPFPGSGAGTIMLDTLGEVWVQEITGPGGTGTGNWWLLIPDVFGSYTTGTWFELPSTSGFGYGPQFFGSAMLPNSSTLIEGGEYNFGSKDDTTKGFLWNPNTASWTSISHPSGWSTIGDAPTVVLANGRFMMGDCCSSKQALFNAKTLTWSSIGSGKADSNSEEGWTLLPASTGNKVLTVDTQNGTNSELFDPTPPGTWSLTGKTPFFLGNNCGLHIVPEMGPAVLRPNGTVFQAGANGKSAIYNASTGAWSKGPSFPSGFGVADGPAAILPDGNVLVQAGNISPCFTSPSLYYEFDGTDLDPVPAPPNAPSEASFNGRMLVLPNGGHILHTDGTTDLEVYIPNGAANSSCVPTITSFPSTVTIGNSYTIKGKKFNGCSQGAAYGDDAQMATNFPLVRFTFTGTGHVFYGRTKNFSNMGVQTGSLIVSATLEPPGVETGAATAVVVTNGIASSPVFVTVK